MQFQQNAQGSSTILSISLKRTLQTEKPGFDSTELKPGYTLFYLFLGTTLPPDFQML